MPQLDELEQRVCLLQGVGEAIFVPSGWHHTVENLEDTLSINHNWLNGLNMHWGWALLQRERVDAAAAIEDCRCRPSLLHAQHPVMRIVGPRLT